MTDEVRTLDTRLCKQCECVKPLEEMSKDKKGRNGYANCCRSCKSKRDMARVKANPEKRNSWVKANKESLRDYNKTYLQTYEDVNAVERQRKYKLKTVFGLSPEQYDNMLETQNYCCLICHRHQTEFKRRLAVDHCHVTNKVRGLLCSHCNLMLGQARDNIDVLQTAIQYLKENQ